MPPANVLDDYLGKWKWKKPTFPIPPLLWRGLGEVKNYAGKKCYLFVTFCYIFATLPNHKHLKINQLIKTTRKKILWCGVRFSGVGWVHQHFTVFFFFPVAPLSAAFFMYSVASGTLQAVPFISTVTFRSPGSLWNRTHWHQGPWSWNLFQPKNNFRHTHPIYEIIIKLYFRYSITWWKKLNMKTPASPLRLPPSPLRETSAETVYIFQLCALIERKRRPGKDGFGSYLHTFV